MQSDETVVVRIYSTRQEAEIARLTLESAEILSFIKSDNAGGWWPHLPTSTGVQLVVRKNDLTPADTILKESETK